ncbi:hypothetical protein INR49_002432, partial [Caranx melampygus]
PGKSGNLSRVSSSSSAVDSSTKHLLQKKENANSSFLHNPHISSYGPAPRSPSSLPRGYTTTAGAGSRDSQLDSQHLEVERKKEVRSLQPSDSLLCAGEPGLVEQQDPPVSETMFDGVVLPPTVPFSRAVKPEQVYLWATRVVRPERGYLVGKHTHTHLHKTKDGTAYTEGDELLLLHLLNLS